MESRGGRILVFTAWWEHPPGVRRATMNFTPRPWQTSTMNPLSSMYFFGIQVSFRSRRRDPRGAE
jgi:hypothetical protein